MVTRVVLVLPALVASACAFLVTQPNANQGWTSRGPNTLAWERVETDPTNFTIVLTNTDRSVLPVNNQLIAETVDAVSRQSLQIDAPSGGFPVGGTFRVNLVLSASEISTIYAQSDEFNITAGGTGSTATSSGTGSGTGAATGGTSRTTAVTAGTVTASGTGTGTGATAATTDLNPTSSQPAGNSGMTLSPLASSLSGVFVLVSILTSYWA